MTNRVRTAPVIEPREAPSVLKQDLAMQSPLGEPGLADITRRKCSSMLHLRVLGRFRRWTAFPLKQLAEESMTKQKEEALEVEGVVTQALANRRFRVEIEGGHIVNAHVAGRMRKHFIRIVPGDKVRVELSPYDLTKGRITYRER